MQADLQLFQQIAEQLIAAEENQPVTPIVPPEQLYQQLDLALNDEPADSEGYEKALTDLILNTPKTTSKAFFNQLFGGRNGKAVVGELLSVLLNNSMYTYKVAGPMVGVEKVIINKIKSLLGYPSTAEGTLAAGGSMTNFMGMLMARDRFDAEIRQKGVQQTLIAYTSKEAHYSVPKNAAFIGVGRQNVRYIESNEKGEMLVSDLVAQIEKDLIAGYSPFFVNATAGTTVLGAFDPIDAIADVCQLYGLWLHVDGAYCGSVMFSDKYKHLIKGAHRADSFSLNAHKMLSTPLSCSIILSKEKKHLYDSFSNDASYLYQADGDELNTGKISFQCGRRNDALKFWTLWKAIGTKGLTQMVEHEFALAEHGRQYVLKHPDYEVYSHENSIAVCFNYKGIDAKKLCTLLYEKGKLVVGYGSFRGTTFIRLVTVNAGNEQVDIDNFFKTLEDFVQEYWEELFT